MANPSALKPEPQDLIRSPALSPALNLRLACRGPSQGVVKTPTHTAIRQGLTHTPTPHPCPMG